MAKIGIDLGTTNTVVATIGTAGTRILDNTEGENMTPSVVTMRRDEITVGSVARKRMLIDPLNTVYSVKRLMGRGSKDEEVKKMKAEVPFKIVQPANGTSDSVAVILNNQEYSPVDISCMILKKIKADVEHRLGEEVKDAVITVPAYFSEIQKHATREAGLRAGLNVLRILDEPSAAAISYGINEEGTSSNPKIALVYDLGGGTFDISVLAITAGTTVQLNLEGNMWMGGDNFDRVIIDMIAEELMKTENIDPKGDAKLMAIIKNEAQKAKEILSASKDTDILFEYKDFSLEMNITRITFEKKIENLIQECESLVDKAIKGAGFSGPDDIDIVIMAGNSTLIPAVQRNMENKFGKEKIKRKLHPKLCVAEGAAMAAAMVPVGEIICPKCNHANSEKAKNCEKCKYGFIVEDGDGGVGNLPVAYGIERVGDVYDKFYEKNTPFPIKPENQVTKTVPTVFDNQRMLKIHIVGGDHQKASENEYQGEVFAVLPHGLPSGTGIKIKLWIDKDGLFALQTTLQTGEGLPSIILRGLTDTSAVNLCYTKLTDYSGVKDKLEKKKQLEIDAAFEQVLSLLKNQEFEKAIQLVNSIDLKVPEKQGTDNIVDPPLSPFEMAKNTMNMLNGMLNKYGDFIDETTKYELRSKGQKLTTAINQNNLPACEVLSTEILDSFDNLMFTTMEGQRVPTPLGMVIQTEGSLMHAETINPAAVKPLWPRFEDAKERLKNHDYTAIAELLELFLLARGIIEKQSPDMNEKGMVKCPHPDCGKMTPKNQVNCRYCGRPIIMGGNDSRGYLKNSLSL